MQKGRLTAGPITVRRAASAWNGMSPNLPSNSRSWALACWNLFGLSGYARFDFRVDPTGKPFVIDVNPNPFLAPDAGFAADAAEAGFSFQDLIGRIVEVSWRFARQGTWFAA